MCGLTLTITRASSTSELTCQIRQSLHQANSHRGPNAQGVYARLVDTPAGQVLVTISASVLGLRGHGTTAQPLVGKRGVLAWNGQVFSGLDVGIEENDTAKIFSMLEGGGDIDSIISAVEGPYAYIYYCFATGVIHFKVDPLSRRSMLLHLPEPGSSLQSLIISSSRSALMRERGVDMRALNGGEGATISLKELRGGADEALLFDDALKFLPHTSRIASVAIDMPNSSQSNLVLSSLDETTRFLRELSASVRRRIENIPAPDASDARVAVLFSGGVDCTLLACLIHQFLPVNEPIELINVAFEKPQPVPNRKTQGASADNSQLNPYDVPDRLSGRDAAAELRLACPGREFRFVEVDVDIETSRAHRERVIDLMYPSVTEMDLSLAYPLYFASRGVGQLSSTQQPYTVTAKVYISGLGADEQLGGYTRHRRAYTRGSASGAGGAWDQLINELQLDLDRLPQRNLSRDDRMLSSHGRDARYPYLDISFITYLSGLPVWVKCNPELPAGEGDKLLIRNAARQCGLPLAAARVKRAMQFGTRSAKLNSQPSGSKAHRVGEQLITEAI